MSNGPTVNRAWAWFRYNNSTMSQRTRPEQKRLEFW